MKAFLWIPAASVMAAWLLLPAPAVGHHSSAVSYDPSRTVEIQGSITKFLFKNPHAYIYVDAADANGQTVEWQVEMGAPASMARQGWTPETLKPGEVIKVVGQPSRAPGTHGLCCAKLMKPDGSPIAPARGE